MILADRARQFMVLNYVEPARCRSKKHVVVVARDVIKGLGLKNRTPPVCNALDAGLFLLQSALQVYERLGPKHGRTAAWVLTIEEAEPAAHTPSIKISS